MIEQTKRKGNSRSILAKFWNEFLFAREFEYETPLTPDEVIDALEQLHDQRHKAWFLSQSSLVHKVSYNRDGDKSGDFLIELESVNRGKWWETNSALQQVEGTITADSETGLTTVRGRTLFNRSYYVIFLMIFMSNFLAQGMDRTLFFTFATIIIIIAFWYFMYRERNKLADRVDDIIMNAKIEQSVTNLMDDNVSDDWIDSEEILKENYTQR